MRSERRTLRLSSSPMAAVEDFGKIFLILLHEVSELLQVVRHALENLVFLQVLGQRHLPVRSNGKSPL